MSATSLQEIPSTKLFSEDALASINRTSFPDHVAIMMDGNRRWAKKRGLPVTAGHWRGAESLVSLVQAASQLGIKVLTVYALSTENMMRSQLEVRALMKVIKVYLLRQRAQMIREGVRLEVIGDTTKLPSDVQKILSETKEATVNGKKLDLVLALNYGARDEIKRAVCRLVDDCLDQKLPKAAITETLLSSYLDTAKWKDPDLLIRTGGENRMSNFLLWQTSYTEMFITDTLWPDFCEKDLLSVIVEYQHREMRGGR